MEKFGFIDFQYKGLTMLLLLIIAISCNSKGDKGEVESHSSQVSNTLNSNLPMGEMVLIPEGYFEMGATTNRLILTNFQSMS